MSPETLGLVFVCVLSVALFAGFPIAFTLIVMSLVFGYIGFGIRVNVGIGFFVQRVRSLEIESDDE